MSDPPYDVEKDPYPLMSKWRQSERHNMIAALRDLIDEASRMAKSKRAPASERIRWTRLCRSVDLVQGRDFEEYEP